MQMAIGAFVCIDEASVTLFSKLTTTELTDRISKQITYPQFESKKSTWSEIKTLIAALKYVNENFNDVAKIEIYTDCQSICDLLGRRKEKLLKTNFITRAGKILQNAEVYKELFSLADKFAIQIYKVKGHASSRATIQEKIFEVVDKLSRQKLRNVLSSLS